jgi:hypothetical protein
MRRSSAVAIDAGPLDAGSARAALRAWLARLGTGGDPHFAPESGTGPAEASGVATSFENRVRRLRADAHAAYHSVEGTERAAIDAALAVLEAEWHAARALSDGYAEALKAIRVYGRDPGARDLAARALALRPDRPCTSGWSRYPFDQETAG